MRKIAHTIFSIFWKPEEDQQLTIVSEYYNHYNQIDQLLQTMPGVLKLFHDDLTTLSKATAKERKADFTSENLFRSLVLMQCEGWTLRETTIRIADYLLVFPHPVRHTLECRRDFCDNDREFTRVQLPLTNLTRLEP